MEKARFWFIQVITTIYSIAVSNHDIKQLRKNPTKRVTGAFCWISRNNNHQSIWLVVLRGFYCFSLSDGLEAVVTDSLNIISPDSTTTLSVFSDFLSVL